MESYFTNRKHYTEISKQRSSELDLSIGVPQGSSLGPLFFLIYINDLPRLPISSRLILYADDLVLFNEESNLSKLKSKLETDLILLDKWLKANKLVINTEKTKTILFTRSKIKSNPIRFNNKVIEEVKHYKYLGLTIQSDLKFNKNICEISKKINSINGCIFGLKNILPKFILRRIFYSLAYPHINYHILAWGGSSSTIINPIKISVNKVIRNIDLTDTNTANKYKNLGILTVDQVYKLRLGQFMQNLTHENNILLQQPDIYWSHIYPQRNPNLFRRPNTITEIGRQTFLFKGISYWAQLPHEITDIKGTWPFKN